MSQSTLDSRQASIRNTILTLWDSNTHQTTINNTKYPQCNHTLPHNIPSQTKFNLNAMEFLGETRS